MQCSNDVRLFFTLSVTLVRFDPIQPIQQSVFDPNPPQLTQGIDAGEPVACTEATVTWDP